MQHLKIYTLNIFSRGSSIILLWFLRSRHIFFKTLLSLNSKAIKILKLFFGANILSFYCAAWNADAV